MQIYRLFTFMFVLLFSTLVQADNLQTLEMDLPSGETMELRFLENDSPYVLLWFPCDQGLGSKEEAIAREINQLGVEVWLMDLLGAYFAPIAPSSMRELRGEDVTIAIGKVFAETRKPVVLLAQGYGAVPALRGVRAWQHHGGSDKILKGVILLFPELMASEPVPGQVPEYLPVTEQVATQIKILQPERTPARFWLEDLSSLLVKGGSQVDIQILPKIKGYFFTRDNANAKEKAATEALPQTILDTLNSF